MSDAEKQVRALCQTIGAAVLSTPPPIGGYICTVHLPPTLRFGFDQVRDYAFKSWDQAFATISKFVRKRDE